MLFKSRVLYSGYFGSSGGSNPAATSGDIQAVSTPTIYNLSVTLADTEESQALPIGTKYIRLANHGPADIKYAYASGESGTNYLTLNCGAEIILPGLDSATNYTIYYQSAVTGGRLEIESWA